MGISAYKAVWQHSTQKGTVKLTLLALAEFASEKNNWQCWPSIDTLTDMVGLSRRQVQRHLKTLEASGEIKIKRSKGRGRASIYDLSPLIPKQTPKDRYKLYLQSTGWKITRKKAIARAGNKCSVCATTSRLQVHHNDYSRLGAELPTDLTVLCAKCHQLYHNGGK